MIPYIETSGLVQFKLPKNTNIFFCFILMVRLQLYQTNRRNVVLYLISDKKKSRFSYNLEKTKKNLGSWIPVSYLSATLEGCKDEVQ